MVAMTRWSHPQQRRVRTLEQRHARVKSYPHVQKGSRACCSAAPWPEEETRGAGPRAGSSWRWRSSRIPAATR